MKITIFFHFLCSVALGERFLQLFNRKILITYDQTKEALLILNINNSLIKRIARESCENRGLFATEPLPFELNRRKRRIYPELPKPPLHAHVGMHAKFMKLGKIAGKALAFKMNEEFNKAIDYITHHPLETGWGVYLFYQVGSTLRQQFKMKKEIITLTKGETLLINITRNEEMERKREGIVREAFHQIFTLNRLSPIVVNTNKLTEYILDEQIDNDVNLYDLISAHVTGCFENMDLNTFGIILSIELPQFRVFNATSEIDIGFTTKDTYSYLKLDKYTIKELNVKYAIDIKKCIKSKMHVCPSSSLKTSQCNNKNFDNCEAEVILLNKTYCGITNIRQDIDFGHILIVNAKEIIEVNNKRHHSIKISPNTPVQLRIQESSTINICGTIIKPIIHSLNLTTLNYGKLEYDQITEIERQKIEKLLSTINVNSEDGYWDTIKKNVLLILGILTILFLLFSCCSCIIGVCYFLKHRLLIS